MKEKIRIPIDNTTLFNEFLNEFNISNKTDFKVVSTDFLDGVEFVYLIFERSNVDDIFQLGYSFAGFRIRKGYL